MHDPIAALLRKLQDEWGPPRQELADAATPDEPDYLRGIYREIAKVPPEHALRPPSLNLDEARELIRQEIREYLSLESPDHLLLVKALPGVGKTTLAVQAAEEADLFRRTFYAGPRHDFFHDVMRMAARPDDWYEWLPRQKATEGKIATCPYEDEIGRWLHKGYKAISFCRQICGPPYMEGECVYHKQTETEAPILFVQHQHATLGHLMMEQCRLLIGDEYPVPSFCNSWSIPGSGIWQSSMDYRQPFTEMLHRMVGLCERGVMASGLDLLTLLGGPQAVLDAAGPFTITADMVEPPQLFEAEDVDKAPYNHLTTLLPLLAREARAALTRGNEYPARVYLDAFGLCLLLRHTVNEKAPGHVIWLDATAPTKLYETVFRRRVKVVDAQPKMEGRVYQISDRANGKTTLMAQDKETGKSALTYRVSQAAQMVERIIGAWGYERPAVISFKKVIEDGMFASMQTSHFYAARGTNSLEGCDALFVVGTPQPAIDEIVKLAKMVYFERMDPFQPTWTTRDVRYVYVDPVDGMGRAYPVSGFWGDPELQEVLESLRESEIVQAAHRVRPLLYEVDVWLLTNIPLAELPPDQVVSTAELFGAADDVNAYTWEKVVKFSEALDARQPHGVTVANIVSGCGVSEPTAYKYRDKLLSSGWELLAITRRANGRPPQRFTRRLG